MARLEDLRPNFMSLSANARRILFLKYVEERQRDLDTVIVKAVKEKREKDKKVAVTTSQLEGLRKLGLV